MFDYQQDFTQLYVWPVPIISGTINCSTTRRASEVLDLTTEVDVPAEPCELCQAQPSAGRDCGCAGKVAEGMTEC